jgi:hypothetical protein
VGRNGVRWGNVGCEYGIKGCRDGMEWGKVRWGWMGLGGVDFECGEVGCRDGME